jgi:limonene-1,2-epoxide hydrolase
MEPELYQDKGCKAHDYVKDRMTQHVQTLVEEGINESIQNIHGVQEARTTIETGEMGIKSSIVILRDDGEEVVVDGATI